MSKRISPLERILGKVDDLDSVNLSILVQRLARERRLLESVFNAIQEGVLVVNRSGIIEYANQVGRRLINLHEKDVGKSILWKMVPELAKSMEFAMEGELDETSVISRELEIHYPEHRYLQLHVVPFWDGQKKNQEIRFAFILNDVTATTISTAEKIETERTSSIFLLAAGVAHELGNPINSLNIHMQLIRRMVDKHVDGATAEKILSSIDICSQEISRLDGIIKNFLEAIKPNPPDLKEIDPVLIVEEVISFMSKELEDLGISISINLNSSMPMIMADHNQLKQVFFNIIKNSMEAMREGGTIQIGCKTDADHVYLQFIDSGAGISQEDFTKIFEPYFTTKEGGNGLGMMIVQRILRDHGAQIGVDSQVGKGTIITLTFPHASGRMRLVQDS